MAYDILIKGGRIYDGSGLPSYLGDVAVQDGKIVMFDTHHLTASFSKTFATEFRGVMAEAGK